MYGDAYRDPSHSEIQQLIWRKVAQFADYAQVEQRLLNNKVADVFYQCGRTTVIVEVKTQLKDSLIETAFEKYGKLCDYLVIASPAQLIRHDKYDPVSGWRAENVKRVGIWWVSWEGITEIRPAHRLDVKTPGLTIRMGPALSPFAVIGSPACTARRP